MILGTWNYVKDEKIILGLRSLKIDQGLRSARTSDQFESTTIYNFIPLPSDLNLVFKPTYLTLF